MDLKKALRPQSATFRRALDGDRPHLSEGTPCLDWCSGLVRFQVEATVRPIILAKDKSMSREKIN